MVCRRKIAHSLQGRGPDGTVLRGRRTRTTIRSHPMLECSRSHLRCGALALGLALLGAGLAARSETKPVDRGQRVFTCGHSFHVFVPGILADMARGAGIPDHKIAGLSSIGGSRVIQHWDVADEKNKAKQALR